MTKVTDGTQISVRYGRPVTVTIDGLASTKWVTATTVEEALGEFGVGGAVKISDLPHVHDRPRRHHASTSPPRAESASPRTA